MFYLMGATRKSEEGVPCSACLPDRCKDFLKHLICFIKHLMIGKTYDAIPQTLKNVFSLQVRRYLLLMDGTIHFDHKSRLQAGKVHNEPVDLMLAVKAVTAQLAVAQVHP